MARIRQVRDVIVTRKDEEFEQAVSVEEAKVRVLAGAIYGSQGQKKGAAAASKIELIDRSKLRSVRMGKKKQRTDEVPSTAAVKATFGMDPMYGLITPEQIEAEAQKIREARGDG